MPNAERTELAQHEERVRSLRTERARVSKLADAAKAAFEEHESDATLLAAKGASDALREIDAQIDQSQDEQLSVLRKVADRESGKAGFSSPGVNGWDMAAEKLSLSEGSLRVDVPAMTLLRAQSPSIPNAPRDGSASVASAPEQVSFRYLYPVLGATPFGSGELVGTDFVVTSYGSDAVSGIEREPDAVTEKAVMSPDVALATPEAKTFAIVIEKVPSKLFSSGALRALLAGEASRQLDGAVDDHAIAAIESATPPHSATGADLVAKIRNGVAASRNLGSNPTVLALSSTDAAALDLTADAGGYVFTTRLAGSGSPVWSMQVREAEVAAPTLIDPARLGVLYVGDGSVLVDPYTGLSTNEVDVRVEVDGKYHVRDKLGAYVIS